MPENTYDVLRAAGLVPELVCAGCQNKISANVVPWAGEGYVTHPNDRCSAKALDRAPLLVPEPLYEQDLEAEAPTLGDFACKVVWMGEGLPDSTTIDGQELYDGDFVLLRNGIYIFQAAQELPFVMASFRAVTVWVTSGDELGRSRWKLK